MHPLESPTPCYPPRFSVAWCKFVLGLIFLAPVRIVAIVSVVLLFGGVAELIALSPAPKKNCRAVISAGAMALMRVLGLRHLQVDGKRDLRAQIIVANHTSWIEPLLFCYLGYGQLAATERLPWPMNRWLLLWFDNVNVDRSTGAARLDAAKTIMRRATDCSKQPLVIYPEGTVSNGRSLLRFKSGAFAAGAPVQPVVLSCQSPACDLSWTFGCDGYLWRILAQPYFNLTVRFMTIHMTDRTNPAVYAEAVRARMASELGVPLSDVDARTAVLMGAAESLGLPLDAGKQCYDDSSISTKQHRGLLAAFAAVNRSKTGQITKAEVEAAIPSPGPTIDEVIAAMGGAELYDVPAFVAGARQLLQRDAAFRRVGLALLDPTGAVVAAYGGPK